MKKNKKSVILYLHTHWDPEWYRSQEEFDIRLVEVFDKVLNSLQNGEAPSFYFDGQVLALLNYLKYRPQKKSLIKKLIKEKKLFIGPFFASIDSFLVSGESLIKNLELGIKIAKDFGQNEFIGYLSDTFGHSTSAFEALKQFNIDKAIIWRGVPLEFPSDFTANGIKTTRLVRGYYQDILHTNLSIEKKAEVLEKEFDKIAEKSGDVILFPIGADHLALPCDVICQVNEINKLLKNYKMEIKNLFDYFNSADYSKFNYDGEFLDNSETFLLQGVYSSRIKEKIENAKLENELFKKTAPLNIMLGGKYEAELRLAEIELTKNHAHDSIYGCSTDNVHKKVRSRQIAVKDIVKTVQKNLIRDFKEKNLIKNSTKNVGIFNFSNYPLDIPVKIVSDKKIENGQKIRTYKTVSDDIYYNIYKNPMTEDYHDFFEYLVEIEPVAPKSFQNFTVKRPEKKQIAGDDFIENPYLKLFVTEGKIFVLNKENGELYSDFAELHSTPDGGDSYNFAPLSTPQIIKFESSKKITNGPIKSTLELKFEENIKLQISLTNNSKFFEIEVKFNNKKKNRKLQLALNTNSPVSKTLSGTPTGKIERLHDPNYLLFYNMPTTKREELKTGSYPMAKFVYANKIGVITEGLCEYEVYKNSLKITLLRSSGIISNPKNKARGVPAGPPVECPDMQCLGEYKARLAITFDYNIEKITDEFMPPYIAILGEFEKTF